VFTEFPFLTDVGYPFSITVGSDGNLWFTDTYANNVGRITLAGVVTEFPIPTPAAGAHVIAAGTDGNLWFAEAYGSNIVQVTTAGVFREFTVPTADSYPNGVASGLGRVWFTESRGNKIGGMSIGA
jgi:virginiamycin B lyase